MGTILLNVLLGGGMKVERMGINNLLLVCVANPPIYQVTMFAALHIICNLLGELLSPVENYNELCNLKNDKANEISNC